MFHPLKFFGSCSIHLAVLLAATLPGCGEFPAGERTQDNSGQGTLAGQDTGDADVLTFQGDPGETFQVEFDTTAGKFVVEVYTNWAPNGARRFRELVSSGYFDGNRFFRVVPGFMVQWGIHGDPQVSARWRDRRIQDDPVLQSNQRGTITFATSGPDSRTTQLFINFSHNARLNNDGFSPFGRVISGMDVVDNINSSHGESPHQPLIQTQGNAYLDESFPGLDYIKSARIVKSHATNGNAANTDNHTPTATGGETNATPASNPDETKANPASGPAKAE